MLLMYVLQRGARFAAYRQGSRPAGPTSPSASRAVPSLLPHWGCGDPIVHTLNALRETQLEHGQTLARHEQILTEHSQVLAEHSQAHGKTLAGIEQILTLLRTIEGDH
jgi:hypothetical protein